VEEAAVAPTSVAADFFDVDAVAVPAPADVVEEPIGVVFEQEPAVSVVNSAGLPPPLEAVE